jgi:hypothetical protein
MIGKNELLIKAGTMNLAVEHYLKSCVLNAASGNLITVVSVRVSSSHDKPRFVVELQPAICIGETLLCRGDDG